MCSNPFQQGHKAPRFSLGQVLATPAALETLQACSIEPVTLLRRHVSGDWGDVCPEDAEANEDALVCGARLFSVYVLPNDVSGHPVKVWVITEADRQATTLLLPDEY